MTREDTCACGCGTLVTYNGLHPRFAGAGCRQRWIERLALRPEPAGATVVPAVVESAASAPEAPAAVAVSAPVPMTVRTPPRTLFRLLVGAVRRVW